MPQRSSEKYKLINLIWNLNDFLFLLSQHREEPLSDALKSFPITVIGIFYLVELYKKTFSFSSHIFLFINK